MLEITAKADLLVKKYNMLSHGDFVVVGVSGGADSMALLCYLLSKREELDLRILVANVEHGIRGEESVADTEFVKQFCKSKDVEFATISINAVDEAKQNSLGVEEYSEIKDMSSSIRSIPIKSQPLTIFPIMSKRCFFVCREALRQRVCAVFRLCEIILFDRFLPVRVKK